MSRKEVGNMLKEARKAKGLTVRQAAEKLDINFGYYSKIENGQITIGKHAPAIARLYRLNPDELLAKSAQTLPTFGPYLRAKYDLTDDAIAELERHFDAVKKTQSKRRRPA
jgi:transcriptional regulator with XRE-family HTH domain